MKLNHFDYKAFHERFANLYYSFMKECNRVDDILFIDEQFDKAYEEVNQVQDYGFHSSLNLNEKLYEWKKQLGEEIFQSNRDVTIEEASNEYDMKEKQLELKVKNKWELISVEIEQRLNTIENEFIVACRNKLSL